MKIQSLKTTKWGMIFGAPLITAGLIVASQMVTGDWFSWVFLWPVVVGSLGLGMWFGFNGNERLAIFGRNIALAFYAISSFIYVDMHIPQHLSLLLLPIALIGGGLWLVAKPRGLKADTH